MSLNVETITIKKETAVRLHRLLKDLTSDNPDLCPYEILAIKELENKVI